MKSSLLVSWAWAALALSAGAGDPVLWDLAKNPIPVSLQMGTIAPVAGTVPLRNGAAFAVPADAFPNQRNFTVQVTASLGELVPDSVFTVMSKHSAQDDGFSLSMNYRESPWYARQVTAVVNNILMTANAINGQRGPQPNTPYTFTVAVRDGFASFYIDDVPYKSCYMELIPNREPLWIGRNPRPETKSMPVTIHRVQVFGPSYVYRSQKEPKSEFPRGAVAGKGWALDIPKIEHPEWPKVLIYGDSISMGYKGTLIPELLKRQIYVFHCVHFVGGEVPEQALTEMASRYRFDVAVFNNGLHSLHWTAGAVSDQQVQDRMHRLARCFKQGAPQAKIYYLTTTPHTAARPAPNLPVADLGDKNDVVIRLNKLSAPVMQAAGIEIIDVYTPLTRRLELASGDGYHWQGPAYQLISHEVTQRVCSALGKVP